MRQSIGDATQRFLRFSVWTAAKDGLLNSDTCVSIPNDDSLSPSTTDNVRRTIIAMRDYADRK